MAPRPKHSLLADLRRRIGAVAGARGPGRGARARLPTGLPAIDDALPGGGLDLAAVHELLGGNCGAATGLAAALATRACEGHAPVVWCLAVPDLHPPGLAAFGLAPDRLIAVRAGSAREVLWAMEEALRTPGLAAVVGEVQDLDLTAGRRLQLAAEAGGGIGLVLRPGGAALPPPSAASTRWRVSAAPGAPAPEGIGLGNPRWLLELIRVRGGGTGAWLIEWDHEAHRLRLAAPACDRPALPRAARA